MDSTHQHIGIVGCSAEGAALCYRTICEEGARKLGGHAHPEVSMNTASLADYTERIEHNDWRGVAEIMLKSARKLASAGADFLVCPDNTIHQALPHVVQRSPLPWLHIAEVVAQQAARRGFRRLGLLGTRWLVESDVYPDKLALHGIGLVLPSPVERDDMHRIIMDELVRGTFRPEATAAFQRVISRMKRDGCDAVVLGCTEIPLVVDETRSALPPLDSTRLLAHAALDRAIQPRSPT